MKPSVLSLLSDCACFCYLGGCSRAPAGYHVALISRASQLDELAEKEAARQAELPVNLLYTSTSRNSPASIFNLNRT